MAVETRWPAGTARRAIAPRAPQDLSWSLEHAEALLDYVRSVANEGLDPADYSPQVLRSAIAAGQGALLDSASRETFFALATDLRDGRTPLAARRGYLMEDPDAARIDIGKLMNRALVSGDVSGALGSLNPTHPDFAVLRAALPASTGNRRAAIRANMDRWRWLPRDLGGQYLLVNVPEYMLRLMVNGRTVNSYRTIVGEPGRNATPQLLEMVEGVVLNPTWTVPQSIVKGEGLGRRVLSNPGWARTQGYSATRGANGYVGVVQAPGPRNSLGAMKLDMPNEYAIFLHDTPAKGLFDRAARALSHGCVRTENALELALTLARLGGAMSAAEAHEISQTGQYTRVAFAHEVPVYIGYFTMGANAQGELTSFPDIYDRDAPVLASLAQSGGQLAAR